MIKSNGQARCLWAYTAKAKKDYFCCACLHYIRPGEEYTREVWVMAEYLWVHHTHVDCPYDPDEDYIEFLRLKAEAEARREKALENIPKAA